MFKPSRHLNIPQLITFGNGTGGFDIGSPIDYNRPSKTFDFGTLGSPGIIRIRNHQHQILQVLIQIIIVQTRPVHSKWYRMKFRLFLPALLIFSSCLKRDANNIKKGYYRNGELKFIHHYRDTVLDGQATWFYPTGRIEEISIFNDGKAEGADYTFYPSGNLQSYRFYMQDKQTNLGFDYYDNKLQTVKNTFYFNDSGLIYYSRSFDDHGHLQSERGKKPF